MTALRNRASLQRANTPESSPPAAGPLDSSPGSSPPAAGQYSRIEPVTETCRELQGLSKAPDMSNSWTNFRFCELLCKSGIWMWYKIKEFEQKTETLMGFRVCRTNFMRRDSPDTTAAEMRMKATIKYAAPCAPTPAALGLLLCVTAVPASTNQRGKGGASLGELVPGRTGRRSRCCGFAEV